MRCYFREILAFVAAGAVTAVVGFILMPQAVPVASPSPAKPLQTAVNDASWGKERIDSRITAAEQAGTDEKRLKAAADLQEIPLADMAETLERVNLKKGRTLSFVAKVLLIRWAAEDGEAANLWAWKRFRSEAMWNRAFDEIGPAWAAHRPGSLGKWALSAAGETEPTGSELTREEVEAMELPVPDQAMLGKIARWLVTENPHLAYRIVKKRGGYSSEDTKIPLALSSVAKVKEALTAFDGQSIKNFPNISGDEILLYGLYRRWHQLDPEGFSQTAFGQFIPIQTAEAMEGWRSSPSGERAAYASRWVSAIPPTFQAEHITVMAQTWAEIDPDMAAQWLDSLPPEQKVAGNRARVGILAKHNLAAALDWADQLSVDQRKNLLVPAFDAWTKAHPGEAADLTGWPAARVQAWRDLESLNPGLDR